MSPLRLIRLVLPALFPSWRFFKAVGPSPRVEARLSDTDPWSEVAAAPPRVSAQQSLVRLFWNPDRNDALFLVSLSERLIYDPSDRLRATMGRRIARRLGWQGRPFEYRLVFINREGGELVKAVCFESKTITAQ